MFPKQVILHAQLLRHILQGIQTSFKNPVLEICVVDCIYTWIKLKKERKGEMGFNFWMCICRKLNSLKTLPYQSVATLSVHLKNSLLLCLRLFTV